MKKILVGSTTIAAVGMVAAMAFAAAEPGTGVLGSSHDMTGFSAGSDPYERVCAYCHTPHHAMKQGVNDNSAEADYLPLWSHKLTAEPVWTAYDSVTVREMTQLAGGITDPLIGPSRLCMSCHDGAVAIDQHYGSANTGPVASVGRGGNLFAGGERAEGSGATGGNMTKGGISVGQGGDLSGTHPIGFDYTVAQTSNNGIDLMPVETVWGVPFDGTNAPNPRNKTIGDVLYDDGNGKNVMTCATCHDVHNRDNMGSTGANPGLYNFFIYAPQEDSIFCRTCHIK